jgi:diaminohydroxyphosphoribosylaminopyrimidine deaminase / 5-amino-6-(5-phosphoribosylamino)uracil reductase
MGESVLTQQDQHWMQRALDLAHKSIGLASPNPAVGCVLVKNENRIGEGFHSYDQRDHAEIVALKSAGPSAKGSTAYVTLEPCSHSGRTGPCANALIEAGIARVVVATGDPNPAVNGEGIGRLRHSGITVDVGLMSEEARDLNDGFARYIQTRLPFVTLKAGLSLDGRIAPAPETRAPGAAVMLTSEESRAEVHRMRHASDALITGINTILADNPLLTDRSGLPRRHPLLRVVLDSTLRLPLDSKIVETANNDLIVFCTTSNPERRRILEALNIRVEQVDSEPGSNRVSLKRVLLKQVLERLGELEITSALLEAGSQLNASALAQRPSHQIADKLTLFYAPIFLGPAGVPLLETSSSIKLQPIRTAITKFGPDFRIEAWLRDPWL